MTPRRFGLLIAIAASIATSSGVSALDPSLSPDPAATTTPSVDLRWQPVDGILGGAIPLLSVGTATPIVAGGRFWALETLVAATPPAGSAGSAEWFDPGIWASTDGAAWVRHPLPNGMVGKLTLMPWRQGLAIVEELRPPRHVTGWHFRVWTSSEGVSWRRSGELDLRARGALRGCGFSRTEVTTAGDHLVAVADCEVFFGAGGDLGPGYRSQASAVRVTASSQRPGSIPTYTWTSLDGRHWTRHLVAVRRGRQVGDPWLSQVRAIGRGMAVLTSERRPRLLWSTDGARFGTVADLPHPRNPAQDVDATLDAGGTPTTWVILMDDVAAAIPGQGAPGAVSRLGSDHRWHQTLRTAEPEQVDIASDRDRLVVVEGVPTLISLQAAGVAIRTSISLDQGLTWTTGTDPTFIDDCGPTVAASSTAAVLDCSGSDAAVLRTATLWPGP